MKEQVPWRISDVSEYLDRPLSSVYKMTAPKSTLRIPHVRIAGRVRFRKADIDQWLELLAVSKNEMLARINEKIHQVTLRNGVHS
jgi:excisionase family DNA binding protein